MAEATNILHNSPLLDPVWYRQNSSDLRDTPVDVARHYLERGAREGRNPHPLFDTKFYLEQNPDVAASGANPLVHYILHGAKEGRDPHPLFAASWYTAQAPEAVENPLLHYLTKGRYAGMDPHPLFMSAFYRTTFPDIEAINIEPLTHYLESGANSGLNPNPLFDSEWYLDTYPDVAAQCVNPLLHYRLIGAYEGRNPSPYLNTAEYLKANQDVAASKSLTALGHYLRYGAAEGRSRGVAAHEENPIVSARSNIARPSRVPAAPPASIHLTSYLDWCRLNDPGEGICTAQRRQALMFKWKPVISLVVPVYKVPVSLICALVDSVKNQTYPHWQLCLALAWFEDEELTRYLEAEAETDPRIKLDILKENSGISGNSNAALQLVEGEYIGLLDHDDTLSPNALFEMARALNEDPGIDFLYSDKDTMDESGNNRFNPLFKPAWSPEFMLSVNYLTHFNVMRTSRVREIGGWDPSTDGAQDWDLFLRFINSSTKVRAVHRPLYHWRIIATSVASGLGAKPWAAAAQLRAVTRYLESNGWSGAVATFAAESVIQVNWNVDYKPSILILVIGDGAAAKGDGWTAARAAKAESNGKVIVKYLSISARDFQQAANRAVTESTANVVVLLDANCKPNGQWITELVGPLQSDALAAVGGRLENSAGKLFEGGWVFPGGRPAPVFHGETVNHGGVYAAAWCCRNHLAVSGSLMAVRRSAWVATGGFSSDPAWQRYDLDLGIKISGQSVGRVMLNTYARATSSAQSVFARSVDQNLGSSPLFSQFFPTGDPFFHPGLIIEGTGRPTLRPVTPPHQVDFFADARFSAANYDAPADAFEKVKEEEEARGPIRSIAWFVPNFDVAFYGGIHTILRAADYMRSRHGMRTIIVAIGAQDSEILRLTISRAFPELAASCDIKVIRDVKIPSDFVDADAAVATLWVTAYAIIRLKNVKHRFYFVQDYEPLFYPAGSTYSLAEATYRFGFHGICNTYPLQQLYEQQGGTADHFLPAVDNSVFHPRGRVPRDPKEPFILFNYARPAHPRNCFEVVAEGLIELKRRMKDRLRIITAGAEWDPKEYGLNGIVEHMGLLPYRQTGDLYRSVDAGIVAMATSHPSYLPFELMACGALVLTNYNQHTQWLLKDQENCVLFNLTKSAIADTLEGSLDDPKRLEKIMAQGVRTISGHYNDWDRSCEAIASAILRGVNGRNEQQAWKVVSK
ncbi:glycosyltransferase [Methylocapsa sp. S129]|uniref:rhamnosyltransferase WsaF family glycosyltransferase n=1 Tax=Methylocapsa sp. S129 TaxID=1641869 RepID=UPI00131A9B66|nr:glycosyltransferase [Methylocapsa sp. S129]